jgi:hypothetical protein
MVFIIIALRRIGRGVFSKLFSGTFMLGWMGWDFSLVLVNLLTFKRKVGRVTPKGQPGEGGVWPEYIPPREGDSRCSCPALNAMANHGLLFLQLFFFLHFVIPRWINTSYPYHIHDGVSSFLNRFLCFSPTTRYHPSRWAQYRFPRDIRTNTDNLQFLSFLLRLRAPPHSQHPQPFIQDRALRPVRH